MRDEVFAKLSIEDQRREVAKDVLRMLGAGKLVAGTGTYLSLEEAPKFEILPDAQMSELVGKFTACDVCALGALFLTTVTRLNECTAQEAAFGRGYGGGVYMQGEPHKYLERLFDRGTLNYIESAFEGWGDWEAEYEQSLIPGDPDERLRVIMQNIADNGDFALTPEQFSS